VEGLCSYVYPSPPSPPLPGIPPGVDTTTIFRTKVEFTRSLPYTSTELVSLKDQLAILYNVPIERVQATVEAEVTTRRGRHLASSYLVTVTIESSSEAAMNSVTNAVESDMSSLESARSIFGDSVTSLPTVASKVVVTMLLPPSVPPITSPSPSPPSESSDGLGVGVIVGIVIGALAGLIIIGMIISCVIKKKKAKDASAVSPSY